MRVRIARDELRRIRELTQTIKALEAEIAELVAQIAPHLLTEPGFGPLTAAKLVGEIAGAGRFASDAKLARAAGVAPIPVSSGKTNRHRLDRGGNRQINATIHRIAVTRLRCHPETQDYIARKRAEGKSTKEAIRCLKRHLTRRIWHLLPPPAPNPDQTTPTHQLLDIGAAKAVADEANPPAAPSPAAMAAGRADSWRGLVLVARQYGDRLDRDQKAAGQTDVGRGRTGRRRIGHATGVDVVEPAKSSTRRRRWSSRPHRRWTRRSLDTAARLTSACSVWDTMPSGIRPSRDRSGHA